ncbi:MAG: ribosome small subunit-dependent GTPase A [Clostridiales bacterium]|jgi:ribosome biogenesis GTPase|nr:ribosome small subunit-dependent GTPase A [Clostridiales bacterium]
MTYKVLQAKRGGFLVRGADGREVFCPARGKLREGGVYAGDDAEWDRAGGIDRVAPRKNLLARPLLANVAACVIVLSPAPAPDFYLADKLLIHCFKNGIEPILCVNKSDTGDAGELYGRARRNYEPAGQSVLSVSALDGSGIEALRRAAARVGGVTCLAGQSAVGKSSLLNRLLPGINAEVGELSQKIGRGKHTTRACRLYPLYADGCQQRGPLDGAGNSAIPLTTAAVPLAAAGGQAYIADTPGFSMLGAGDLFYGELKYFYPDFVGFAQNCAVRGCNHTREPDCAVIRAAEKGGLCRERWERYVGIFDELRETHKNKYK